MKKKILCLIAEDDFANRKIFRFILDTMNIDYEEALNGYEVIQKIEDDPNKYDFIIMDIRMPKIDGIEATKIVKKKKKYTNNCLYC